MSSRNSIIAKLRKLAVGQERQSSLAKLAVDGIDPFKRDRGTSGQWTEVLDAIGFEISDNVMERASVLDYIEREQKRKIRELLNSNDKDRFIRGQLLVELHRLERDLGKTPSIRDLREHGRFSDSTYCNHFGTWNIAIEEAGLTPNRPPERLSEEEILEDLRNVADSVGGRPTVGEFKEHGRYSVRTVYANFESWDVACEHAGITGSST